MVVRRTDKGDIGLTAAAWLEDRTTTTYQPSHLRPAATARRLHAPPPPPPPMFGPRNFAPALVGAANSRVTSVPSPRLALDVRDNPFARPRGAVGASFWNALGFAGLFASVLIGRVIVQAGQDGAQAAKPRAAATRAAAASQGPTGAAPQDSGAGGVGVNALAPGADRVTQEPAQPAAAPAASQTPTASDETQPAAAAAPLQPTAAAPAKPAASESQPAAAPVAGRSKHTDSSTHAHRGHSARARSEALDWRQETPPKAAVTTRTPEPAPLPAAKPASTDPSAALGTLRINSRPWSQVFIDGRLIGNTPQLGLRLPAGRYTVRLANPELGMTKTLIVNVAAGEFVSRVEMLEEP